MNIRHVEVKDATKLIDYTKIIGGESDNLLFGSEGIGLSIEEEEKFITSIMNNDKQVMLVAIDDEEIIGLANLAGFKRDRVSHQGKLAISVKKDYWGKGASSLLMQGLIDFAKKANIEVISLEVFSDNIRGIKLYEKFGFQQIGVFEKFAKVNGVYKDAILMNLYL